MFDLTETQFEELVEHCTMEIEQETDEPARELRELARRLVNEADALDE